jgi:hypothetical protein
MSDINQFQTKKLIKFEIRNESLVVIHVGICL